MSMIVTTGAMLGIIGYAPALLALLVGFMRGEDGTTVIMVTVELYKIYLPLFAGITLILCALEVLLLN